jgi:transcriptional antiterminator RfaH
MQDPHWYCVRTKRLSEHIATAALRTEIGLPDVFCPRIVFERARRSGRVKVTEALFPCYLFALFDYAGSWRAVRSARGVLRIVGFGGVPMPVPETVIAELREAVQGEETIVMETRVESGDEVDVVAGPLTGLRTVVTRVLPAKQRVAILMEVLGQEREVELPIEQVLPPRHHPLAPRG